MGDGVGAGPCPRRRERRFAPSRLHTPLQNPSPPGIGKALAAELAAQGLNVVLVALDDDLLRATTAELGEKYPAVTFKAVGVDLGQPGFLDPIAKATEGLRVQVVFLNAGYVLTGFFESV